ncbi:hypothetical protein [Actinoplanes sp. NPDC049316]|uniref:hypothetical protein n=1 Tax=Actinoplanes sp. NPDC049316 TaxID=3154727 RepID=UPI0034354CD8
MGSRIPFHRRAAGVVTGLLIGLAGAVVATAPASAHTGELTAAAQCTGNGWTATWTLATTATGGHEGVLSNVKVDVGYTDPPSHVGGSPKLTTFSDGATVTGDTTVSDTLSLSPEGTGAALTLTVTWKVGEETHAKTLHAEADAPTTCSWPPKPEPSTYSASFDCTTLRFKLVNPASSNQVVDLRLTPSEGEQRIVSAEPGETKTESFPATAGFTLAVSSAGGPQPPGGEKPRIIAYERPADCTTGNGGDAAGDGAAGGGAAAGNGDEGGLPVTGAAAGAIAGTAAVLLTLGVGLFVVARRRRVKFTA